MRPALSVLVLAALVASVAAEPVVLVSTNTAVHAFDLSGNDLGELIPGGSPGLAAPQGLAVSPAGELYVTNFFGGVEVFGLDGAHRRSLDVPAGAVVEPTFAAFRGETLVVSSAGTDRVRRFDVGGATPIALPDLAGPPEKVNRPQAVLWDDDGSFLVSMGDRRVARFGADGAWIEDAVGPDQPLSRPLGLLFDGVGVARTLIVANFTNNRVQRYGADGVLIGPFPGGAGGLGPDGLLRLPGGDVLIAYHVSGTVLRYAGDGTPLGAFASAGELGGQRPNQMLLTELPACGADVALPFGVLDLSDVDAFIAGFVAGGPQADLAPPAGVLDLSDIDAFIAQYLAGCA